VAGVAGKKERQRRLARERLLRQQARRAERARQWRRVLLIAVTCCVVIGLGTGGYFLFGTGGGTQAAAGTTHCTYPASGKAARPVGRPPAAATGGSYQATITTNRGPIVADLQGTAAPCTVNSFTYLAASHFFSKTSCHRLTTSGIYVLQCGDPTGTGSGGPGYKFADENLTGARYTAGTLAMANSGPGTNGSQFFIVYRDSTLQAKYTPFGKVVKGLGIIQNVAKAGTDNANGNGDGHPKDQVVIESVTIKKT
jgi:cyclophilin family peptidyl-prolyl cis-trans isomerase